MAKFGKIGRKIRSVARKARSAGRKGARKTQNTAARVSNTAGSVARVANQVEKISGKVKNITNNPALKLAAAMAGPEAEAALMSVNQAAGTVQTGARMTSQNARTTQKVSAGIAGKKKMRQTRAKNRA